MVIYLFILCIYIIETKLKEHSIGKCMNINDLHTYTVYIYIIETKLKEHSIGKCEFKLQQASMMCRVVW